MNQKRSNKRLFVIGAGASVDAGMVASKDLLYDVISFARKEPLEKTGSEFKVMISRILSQLKQVYPNLEEDKSTTWPTVEEYLDKINNLHMRRKWCDGLLPATDVVGINADKEIITLLYWYIFSVCRREANDASLSYWPDFIRSEIGASDVFVSLNYDWLFERVLAVMEKFKFEKWDLNKINAALKPDAYPIENYGGAYDYMEVYNAILTNRFFKPHGSVNWMIGKEGTSMEDGSETSTGFGTNDMTKIYYENQDNVVCYFQGYLKYGDLYNKGLLLGIVPPFGIKGFLNPSQTLKLIESRENNADQYVLLEHLIDIQLMKTVQNINSLNEKDEIWLIGTNLASDKYLLDQIRFKSREMPLIKIFVISPDSFVPFGLLNEFDKLYFWNGTMKEYSISLKNKNVIAASNDWVGLQDEFVLYERSESILKNMTIYWELHKVADKIVAIKESADKHTNMEFVFLSYLKYSASVFKNMLLLFKNNGIETMYVIPFANRYLLEILTIIQSILFILQLQSTNFEFADYPALIKFRSMDVDEKELLLERISDVIIAHNAIVTRSCDYRLNNVTEVILTRDEMKQWIIDDKEIDLIIKTLFGKFTEQERSEIKLDFIKNIKKPWDGVNVKTRIDFIQAASVHTNSASTKFITNLCDNLSTYIHGNTLFRSDAYIPGYDSAYQLKYNEQLKKDFIVLGFCFAYVLSNCDEILKMNLNAEIEGLFNQLKKL
jgi:hypothetical protein